MSSFPTSSASFPELLRGKYSARSKAHHENSITTQGPNNSVTVESFTLNPILINFPLKLWPNYDQHLSWPSFPQPINIF